MTQQTKTEQLAELDREFNSEENCRTGEMPLGAYLARRKLIDARPEPQALAERPIARKELNHHDDSPAKTPAKLMKEDDRDKLKAFEERFKAAADAEDPDAMSAILKDEQFGLLLTRSGVETAGKLLSETGKANAGAQFALAAAISLHQSTLNILAVHTARRKRLEKRIEALEWKPSLKYLGVWTAQQQYNVGEFATDGGSLWHCNQSTRDRPGTSGAWTLAVKRGADGNRYRPEPK